MWELTVEKDFNKLAFEFESLHEAVDLIETMQYKTVGEGKIEFHIVKKGE